MSASATSRECEAKSPEGRVCGRVAGHAGAHIHYGSGASWMPVDAVCCCGKRLPNFSGGSVAVDDGDPSDFTNGGWHLTSKNGPDAVRIDTKAAPVYEDEAAPR